MTEKGTVRSSSPELSSMLLPQLKEVATQLGVEGAGKLKKDALVQAISDLQAANREAAKLEREARRAERNNNRNKKREGESLKHILLTFGVFALPSHSFLRRNSFFNIDSQRNKVKKKWELRRKVGGKRVNFENFRFRKSLAERWKVFRYGS